MEDNTPYIEPLPEIEYRSLSQRHAFWSEWDTADELKQVELVGKLCIHNATFPNTWWDYLIPGWIKKNDILRRHIMAVTVNSYLQDVQDYTIDKSIESGKIPDVRRARFWRDA